MSLYSNPLQFTTAMKVPEEYPSLSDIGVVLNTANVPIGGTCPEQVWTFPYSRLIINWILENKMQGGFYKEINKNPTKEYSTLIFYLKGEEEPKTILRFVGQSSEPSQLDILCDSYNTHAKHRTESSRAIGMSLIGCEVYQTPKGKMILSPYIGKNIMEYVNHPGRTSGEIASVVRQLIRGVDACHKWFHTYCRLSTDNVLVDGSGRVVLTGPRTSFHLEFAPKLRVPVEEPTDDGLRQMKVYEDQRIGSHEEDIAYLYNLRAEAWFLINKDWGECIRIINAIYQGCTNDLDLREALLQVHDEIKRLLDGKLNPKVSVESLSGLQLFKDGAHDDDIRIPQETLPSIPRFSVYVSGDGTTNSVRQDPPTEGRRNIIYLKSPVNPM